MFYYLNAMLCPARDPCSFTPVAFQDRTRRMRAAFDLRKDDPAHPPDAEEHGFR